MRAGSPECSILEELLRGSYEPEELGNLGSTVGWYSVANKRGKTLTRFTRESFTNVARQLIKKSKFQIHKSFKKITMNIVHIQPIVRFYQLIFLFLFDVSSS